MVPTTASASPVNPWGLALAFVGFMLIVIASQQVGRSVKGITDAIPSPSEIPGDILGWAWNLPQNASFQQPTTHPTAQTAVGLSQPSGGHPIAVAPGMVVA